MKLPMNITADLWTSLPTSLALQYRVLPVHRMDNVLILATNTKWSAKKKKNIENAISFSLGTDVRIEEVETDDESRFRDLFAQRFDNLPEATVISGSVTGHSLVILFLNTDDEYAEERHQRLEQRIVLDQPDSLFSFRLASVDNEEDAIQFIRSMGNTLSTILVSIGFVDPLSKILTKLKSEMSETNSDAQIIILNDSEMPVAKLGVTDLTGHENIEVVPFEPELDGLMAILKEKEEALTAT